MLRVCLNLKQNSKMLRSFTSNQLKQSFFKLNSKQFSCTSIVNNLYNDWEKLAQKQLKDKPVDSLTWQTFEVKSNLAI